MSSASFRYAKFWIQYLESNHSSWRDIQDEFEQITRAWTLLVGNASLSIDSKTRDDLILRYVNLLQDYLEYMGRWNEGYIPWMEAALESAHRTGSLKSQFSLLNNLGAGYTDVGNIERAEEYLQEALKISQQLGDIDSQMSVANNLGALYFQNGRRREALQQIEAAYSIGMDQRTIKAAHILNNLGMTFQSLGLLDKAVECYDKALQIHQSNQDDSGISASWNNYGIWLAETGDWQNARVYLEKALELRRKIGDRSREAITLASLGRVNTRLANFKQAIRYLERNCSRLF